MTVTLKLPVVCNDSSFSETRFSLGGDTISNDSIIDTSDIAAGFVESEWVCGKRLCLRATLQVWACGGSELEKRALPVGIRGG